MNGGGMDRLLDEKEAARALHLSVATIRKRRLTKQAPRWIRIGASVRYRESDLIAFLDACPTGGRLTDAS